jgi:hypothetical protein
MTANPAGALSAFKSALKPRAARGLNVLVSICHVSGCFYLRIS